MSKAAKSEDLGDKFIKSLGDGVGSFSAVGPLMFLERIEGRDRSYYKFLVGIIPVTVSGAYGKTCQEKYEHQVCQVVGSLYVNMSNDRQFVNLSATSVRPI